MEGRERVAALDAMYAGIAATKRRRHFTEPPPEINDGYVKLLFAYGHGRLGNAARAHELEAEARAQLAAHADDPIHAWLLDVFAERISGAGTTESTAILPASLLARLEALDRVARFKVDRFRDASWIVGGGPVDALGHFVSSGKPYDRAAETIRNAELVERAIASADAATNTDDADMYLDMALQGSKPEKLGPELAARFLERLLPRIDHMGDGRGIAYARAITIAVHVAPERLPVLLAAVAPLVATELAAPDLVLTLLLCALAPNHRAELAALWRHVPESSRSTPEYTLGLSVLEAPPALEDRPPEHRDPSAAQLRIATLDAALARPFPERFDGPWALQLFAAATDCYGTNSHFPREMIYVVDRIVRGMLDP